MTLQEVLRTNKEKIRLERIRKAKHERNVRIVRNIILVGLLMAVILLTNYYDRKAIDECSKEHDINYCIAGL